MTGPRVGEGRTFLGALARRINTRAVLYVPVSHAARALWLADDDSTDRAADLAALEKLGRDWFDTSPDATDGYQPDPEIAVAEVRSADSGRIGVVVAAKEAGRTWSDSERALVSFAAEFYGPMFDDRATPAPTAPVQPPWRVQPDLESGMRDAVGRGELSLLFQPEVDLLSHEVIAVEALLRWQHPTLGELGPESFITLAERSDLIKIVGAWVIDESIRALADWKAAVPGLGIQLGVNVSPLQMAGDELVALFEAALEAYGVPGDQVCVEITENVPMTDLADVAQTLHQLKAIGVCSALDDVASGYSTVSQLRHLPVDIMKIDRSLVAGIHEDERAQAIVTALIGLALVLGVEVVAEGVEDQREVDTLLRLGCARAQGHYLGKPAPAAVALGLLRERGRKLAKNL